MTDSDWVINTVQDICIGLRFLKSGKIVETMAPMDASAIGYQSKREMAAASKYAKYGTQVGEVLSVRFIS
jgi:hypothetical protein